MILLKRDEIRNGNVLYMLNNENEFIIITQSGFYASYRDFNEAFDRYDFILDDNRV